MSDYILRVERVTKEFSGFVAVNDASLKVRRGTIHALIGPNGAGKSTMFNLVTKFHIPTSGRIFFNDVDITALSPADIALRGIVRSSQISSIFPRMTALENVRFALQRDLNLGYCFWRSSKVLKKLDGDAVRLLDSVGLAQFADRYAAELSYGRKRALEIATTLALDPQLLLLDEPMAGMGHEDVERTAALIEELAKAKTVLMVEHNLAVVSNISDTITVLERGKIVAEGSYEQISKNPQVVKAYLGRDDDE